MERIFVDSNYFIALYRISDSLHEHALRITHALEQKGMILVVSNLIFAETVTVLSQREGKELAWQAGEDLLKNEQVRHMHVDEALQRKSWEIFREVQEKNISFVDCSTVAVMQTEGISTLLTFDVRDFKSLQKQYRISLYPLKT